MSLMYGVAKLWGSWNDETKRFLQFIIILLSNFDFKGRAVDVGDEDEDRYEVGVGHH